MAATSADISWSAMVATYAPAELPRSSGVCPEALTDRAEALLAHIGVTQQAINVQNYGSAIGHSLSYHARLAVGIEGRPLQCLHVNLGTYVHALTDEPRTPSRCCSRRGGGRSKPPTGRSSRRHAPAAGARVPDQHPAVDF